MIRKLILVFLLFTLAINANATISDGEPATAANFNSSFASREVDTSLAGIITFFNFIILDNQTANTVPFFDASKQLVSSGVTPTELAFLSGVTSAIQTQIDSKITSGVGAIVNADVNASANIDATKLGTGAIDNTEFNLLDNLTSILEKVLTSANIFVGNGSNVATGVAVTGDISIDNTGLTAIASGAIVDDDVNATANINATKLGTGAVDNTELNKLDGLSGDLLTTTSTSVVTNKDYDGGTASNTSRTTLGRDTTVNLDLLTDKEGTIAYDNTLDAPVFNNGSVWSTFGAGGGSTLDPPALRDTSDTGNISTSTLTFLDYTTQVFDDDNQFAGCGSGHVTTTETGCRWIAPITGIVEVCAGAFLDGSSSWNEGEQAALRIYREGSVARLIGRQEKQSNATQAHGILLRGCGLIAVVLNDYLEIALTQSSGVSIPLDATSKAGSFEVHYISN